VEFSHGGFILSKYLKGSNKIGGFLSNVNLPQNPKQSEFLE
jgi:hypothetical protein